MSNLQVPALVWGDGARYCGVIERAGFLQLSYRFFEIEGTAVVTMLVSRYKIEVKEEPEFSCETFEERYARITAFKQGVTTT
jgi:hypothetical protein